MSGINIVLLVSQYSAEPLGHIHLHCSNGCVINTVHVWIISNCPLVSVDHSRVKLTLTTSKNDTDYINANFIKVCQECTCTQRHIQSLLPCLPLLADANLKCVSCQTSFFGWFWPGAELLSSGSIRLADIYCDPGSSTPHCAGLLEDALGVRNKGTPPSIPSIFHNMNVHAWEV